MLDQLRHISHEWLATRHGEEKGFCMSRFDPNRLPIVWLAVAWDPAIGRAEAFITWVPIWARRGWALDLMRRRPHAAPGVMELLIAKSVEAAKLRGDAMLSLSLSALAMVDGPSPPGDGTAGNAGSAPEIETAAEKARAFLMEHLARFYDFENLFRWKKKFDPLFEDRYLVYPDPLALPRVTLALIRAQSPGGILTYFGRRRRRPKESQAISK